MNTTLLNDLVDDQRQAFLGKALGVPRDIDTTRPMAHRRAVAICGVRRCGKSTLLRQMAERIGDGFHYLNFDDERLMGFGVEDFEVLMTSFQKRHRARTLLFDEIQNVEGWERFVRRVHDEGYKVVLTGSNARLLSTELGTHLSGRHVQLNLYPFSFAEVVKMRGADGTTRTSAGKAAIQKVFDDYMMGGGFPEYLETPDSELLQRTYEDVLYRDIVARHGIRDVQALVRTAHCLFTAMATEVNYTRLARQLGIPSATTVRQYVDHLERACLLYEVRRFDFAVRRQYVTGRKVYVVDNGMRSAVAFTFAGDRGRLLENLVHGELRRRGDEVYFFQDKSECDFVARKQGRPLRAYQVCLDLTESNRERELRGLVGAAKSLRLEHGMLLTRDQEGSETVDGVAVRTRPVWRWMLEPDNLE